MTNFAYNVIFTVDGERITYETNNILRVFSLLDAFERSSNSAMVVVGYTGEIIYFIEDEKIEVCTEEFSLMSTGWRVSSERSYEDEGDCAETEFPW